MTPPDYEYLRKILKERSGLDLSADKQYLVESRLVPLARKVSWTEGASDDDRLKALRTAALPYAAERDVALRAEAQKLAFAWLAVRAGMARLPVGTTYRQLYGVACLCGIGFTMSLFIAGLAFSTPAVLDAVKIGVLVASGCAAVLGAALLLAFSRAARRSPVTAG